MGDEHTVDKREKEDGMANDLESTATTLVHGLNMFNDKVTAMRTAKKQDPDSLGDKLIKFAFPAIAGLAAGKVFETLWNTGAVRHKTSSETTEDDTQQGLLTSLLFAGLSAAFGAVVSQLSQRGSQSFVSHRQRRRAAK